MRLVGVEGLWMIAMHERDRARGRAGEGVRTTAGAETSMSKCEQGEQRLSWEITTAALGRLLDADRLIYTQHQHHPLK